MSSSRSHSVWFLKCNLVIWSVCVFFSSCVTLTWRKQKETSSIKRSVFIHFICLTLPLLNPLFTHPTNTGWCQGFWGPKGIKITFSQFTDMNRTSASAYFEIYWCFNTFFSPFASVQPYENISPTWVVQKYRGMWQSHRWNEPTFPSVVPRTVCWLCCGKYFRHECADVGNEKGMMGIMRSDVKWRGCFSTEMCSLLCLMGKIYMQYKDWTMDESFKVVLFQKDFLFPNLTF